MPKRLHRVGKEQRTLPKRPKIILLIMVKLQLLFLMNSLTATTSDPPSALPTPTETPVAHAGVEWRQATQTAAFSARIGHSSVVFHDKMWVIGGQENMDGPVKNDV